MDGMERHHVPRGLSSGRDHGPATEEVGEPGNVNLGRNAFPLLLHVNRPIGQRPGSAGAPRCREGDRLHARVGRSWLIGRLEQAPRPVLG